MQTINGITQNRYFLLDDGHTGYAQVFEETAELGGSIVRSYTIGDDVLSQTVAGVTSHLLYDGHGSTRQLTDNNGAVTANYAYDAYGRMLGGDPNVTDRKSDTDLLYAGEQFDPGLQMEYLRARYYDANTGRFNRLDPFAGSSEDPQSLHKYAYCHADPVNGVDPTGNFFLIELLMNIGMDTVKATKDLATKQAAEFGTKIIVCLFNGVLTGALNALDNRHNISGSTAFLIGFVGGFFGTWYGFYIPGTAAFVQSIFIDSCNLVASDKGKLTPYVFAKILASAIFAATISGGINLLNREHDVLKPWLGWALTMDAWRGSVIFSMILDTFKSLEENMNSFFYYKES